VTVVVAREQRVGHDDPADDVADDQLEEREVPEIGDPGNADEREGAGFGGNDRKQDGPPGDGLAGDEIVASVLLAASEPDADRGRRRQIGDDDREIESVKGRAGAQRRYAENELPQPQPPVEFGFLKTNPEPCIDDV
jgi:hypothetical protein